MRLAPLNETLETTGQMQANLSARWVWGSNPEEALVPTALLNQCHLLGLLLCRVQPTPGQQTYQARAHTPRGLVLLPKPPADMTLRELRDSVDNLLIEISAPNALSLPAEAQHANSFIDACFRRFGVLASQGGTEEVLNDNLNVEENEAGAPALKLTRPCLRRFIASFLIAYRHAHLAAIARPVPPDPFDCGIRKHHMEASNDDFALLCMRMRLPAAAVLNYKQDFTGFFNHISQVVYFNNPTYEPLRRIPLADVPMGDPMQVLPAIQQLYPGIKTHYEEDNFDITRPLGYWAWIVLPGRIYLVGPDSTVYHSTNITSLLRVYVEALQGAPQATHGPTACT